MSFQNISNENSGNFFAGFLEWDMFKLIYLIFHIALTFLAQPVLYSIVWYERFGSGLHYRTLTNRILSHICMISIVRCLTARIPYVAILFMSPLSLTKCDLLIFVGQYSFLCTLIEIEIWQLAKYFYIFKWKYLVKLNDKFFAKYLTACNLLLSSVFLFVTYMIGFHNVELDYQICTGNNPDLNIFTSLRYK
jgi:hypothetical protein